MNCVNWRNRWTLRSKTIGKDWQIGTRTQSHRLSLPCSPVELKRTTIINPSTSNQSWIRRGGWNVDVKVPPQSTNECFSNSTLEILPTLEGRAFQEAVCISFTCWGPERHAADVMTCDDMWWHVLTCAADPRYPEFPLVCRRRRQRVEAVSPLYWTNCCEIIWWVDLGVWIEGFSVSLPICAFCLHHRKAWYT